MRIDLNKLSEVIVEESKNGTAAEKISKQFNCSVRLVTELRYALGVSPYRGTNVFKNQPKKLWIKHKNPRKDYEYIEYAIDFNIPKDIKEELKINSDKKYNFTAKVDKPLTIKIHIKELTEPEVK